MNRSAAVHQSIQAFAARRNYHQRAFSQHQPESPPVTPMTKRRLNQLFTLAVPVVLAGGFVAMLNGWGSATGNGLVYDTVPASRGEIRKLVSTSGPVRALVTVSVGSQLSGQVQAVNADFNTEVTPGQVLAVLDRKTYAARVSQAEADLGAAQAALSNQEAGMSKSQAVLQAAELNVVRQKSLADKRLAPQLTYETALRDRDVAKADIDVIKAQIASARATIAQREAALAQVKADLDRTEIRAPIEGTVISRTVDPGQTVAASLQAPELFKIAQDLSRIRIEAQVNEADVGAIAQGNAVTFTVDAYPERNFEGRVTQVRLAATELNNVVTYTVIIEAQNEDRRLFPGMTANVQIEAARRDGVLRVANDALRFRPRGETAGGERTGRGEGGRGNRSEREIERMKEELRLTPDQEKAVRDAMREAAGDGTRTDGAMGSDERRALRQKTQAAVEQTLQPLLSEEQRPLYEKFKQGRQQARFASVYVLGADGQPQRRGLRAGMADDQFTEIVGGPLKEGDKVIVRAREVK
jgi:HlyD family secretion protein